MSDPVKCDPILDQFSKITGPYPRVNGLKTIPFPAAHARIANIWEYPRRAYNIICLRIMADCKKSKQSRYNVEVLGSIVSVYRST